MTLLTLSDRRPVGRAAPPVTQTVQTAHIATLRDNKPGDLTVFCVRESPANDTVHAIVPEVRGTPVDPEHHRLLTPAEVAALFRVDPRTVTRWAVSGRLHSIRTPGGHRRFPEKDVLALLEGIGAEPQDASDTQGAESPANGAEQENGPP